ncbi:hypothetical protein [Arthrobacter methylotrophus]|uniref:Uncharacterized protein n=1 Tax=Arthrobacter methylotrophus TaxID=121291 RepID=A0ABV5UTL3_9MICC
MDLKRIAESVKTVQIVADLTELRAEVKVASTARLLYLDVAILHPQQPRNQAGNGSTNRGAL